MTGKAKGVLVMHVHEFEHTDKIILEAYSRNYLFEQEFFLPLSVRVYPLG